MLLEALIVLLVLQHLVFLYLLITSSKWLDNLLGKLPEHPLALDIFEEDDNELLDEDFCICGAEIDDCPDAYEHMTSGV